MTQVSKPRLPIGYWLKKADEALTVRINEAQQANGLNRTEWQILNWLYESSSATTAEMTEVLRPFVDTDTLNDTVQGLVERGLIAADGSAYSLTDDGRHVHGKALEIQTRIRQHAMQGIGEAEYLTTISVLERIVFNLMQDKR